MIHNSQNLVMTKQFRTLVDQNKHKDESSKYISSNLGDLIRSDRDYSPYMKKKAVMTRPMARVNTDKVGYIATAIGLAIGVAA